MLKKFFKIIIALTVLLGVFLTPLTAFAAVTNTYTNINEADGSVRNAVSRETYEPIKLIRASDFGLSGTFEDISDLFCYNNQLYALCSAESEIVVLNADYSFSREIVLKDENGEKIPLEGAKGIFVDSDILYLCDTSNGRVLLADMNGAVKGEWGIPDSDAIPEGFLWQPTRIAKDKDGYFYILGQGCYYGAMVFAPNGEFTGFFGSNRVESSVLDTLSYLWELATSNETKKASSMKTLPYSFVDLCFDSDGYMITCTGTSHVNSNKKGQINKISPNGANILFKRDIDGSFSGSSNVNFLERKVVSRKGSARVQNIIAVDVDENGYMFALDSTYGLIYVYDRECNLISAFGGGVGGGERLGNFVKASCLTFFNGNIVVGDADGKSITVFSATPYGKALLQAQNLYLSGDYDEAEPFWQRVMALDKNNQLAFKGMAMICYNRGDTSGAMSYARAGLDYSVYDMAYQKVFKGFITDNFIWLFPLLVLSVGAVIGLIIYKAKKQIVWIKQPKAQVALSAVAHPFRAYSAVKYNGQGSYVIAGAILAMFFIASLIKKVGSGFLYTDISVRNYNVFVTLAQTAGLIFLWSVVNWLMCTLFQGKGSFKDVFVSSCYALTPLTVYTFIRVILSYILPLSGKGLLDGIYAVVLLYTFYLLSVAMITVHEFTFSKFLLSTVVTVLCMILTVFIIFMIIILLQQFWNFIYSVIVEAVYR